MGGANILAKPIPNTETPTSTAIYRNISCVNGLLERPEEGINTVHDLALRGITTMPNREVFGQRRVIRIVEETKEIVKKLPTGEEVKEKKTWKFFELSPFEFLTWKQAETRIAAIGSGYRALGLRKNDRVTLYAETSRDWILNALGAYHQSLTITTAYATLGEDGLTYSLNECDITTIFTNAELLPMINSVTSNVSTLKNIIYNGTPDPIALEKLQTEHPHLKILTLDELEVLGASNPHDAIPPSKEDLAMIMYTSGSTGTPKGVMLTHANVIAATAGIANLMKRYLSDNGPQEAYLSFLPLAHILEFVGQMLHIYLGSRIGYASVRTLTDASVRNCKGDIRELRPTFLTAVPVVWESIRKAIESKLSTSSPFAQNLFNSAFALKWSLLNAGRDGLAQPLDRLIFNKIKDQVGGRLRFGCSAGASLPMSTQKFMTVCAGNVLNGYGMTECAAVLAVQGLEEKCDLGTTGSCMASCEVKLVDVPDHGYKVSNKPLPQGEIWVRGPSIMKGYFKQDNLTRETLTEDGWLMTGDIAELGSNGSLRIIDRKKNLVKLSNGEYIALEKLESNYKVSKFVQNICVYADPEQSYAIALVQPVEPKVRALAAELNLFPNEDVSNIDLEQVCTHPKVRSAVLASLKDVGKSVGFKSAEIVGNVYLTPIEWTPMNGLLTAAMKLSRNDVLKRFKKEVSAMYSV
ncbi:long-chain fatty acid-CoA ligase [Physocladia obscura]|uniref:Long-chain fatty acid-CoA ligase n=1 Tax=Physocladia obscura TaxID=109957 RepID=A0AAD5T6U3_9FUNG|nr:long-chain fatty acid-CoA ligase [Physocladia obscura]